MLSDGEIVGDGSWNLTVYVTDMDVERTMVVKGDMHIGGVMLKLVETLGVTKDWSDHALWWPQRNKWLSRARSTLDQCAVHADAVLHFTPMHKPLRVQLPDLRHIDCRIDFSIDTFSAVIQLCKTLGIRHPEELSLRKPVEAWHLKQNYQNLKEAKQIRNGHPPDTNTFVPATSRLGSSGSLDRSGGPHCPATPPPPRSLSATPVAPHQNGTLRRSGYGGYGYGGSDGSSDGGYCGTPPRAHSLDALDALDALSLAESPHDDGAARDQAVSPKTLVERARMNVGWLDSSLSIMEQGVREWDTLELRFKFYSFYDLSAKPADAARLNQLYQQARHQLLSQELACTDEEMLAFAALQLQIELCALSGNSGEGAHNGSAAAGAGAGAAAGAGAGAVDETDAAADEIEAALSQLQAQLEGGARTQDITRVPELAGHLKYLRPKRFTLKAYKRGWVVCREGRLLIYASQEACGAGHAPLLAAQLRSAEVTPDASPQHRRYTIRLDLCIDDAVHELYLRCDTEEQYAEWVGACRVGARGRSLADAAWRQEVDSVRALLALQKPPPDHIASPLQPHRLPRAIAPENYIAPRHYKRLRHKFTERVLERHANVQGLGALEARLQYVRLWRALPDHGRALFVVRWHGARRDDLLAVTPDRLLRIDISTGDHVRTWRYSTMKAWNVNWEVKVMMVQFEEGNIMFSVHSADCKVVHEFIGGYIFLSMRAPDKHQQLDHELFHKLTGGWA